MITTSLKRDGVYCVTEFCNHLEKTTLYFMAPQAGDFQTYLSHPLSTSTFDSTPDSELDAHLVLASDCPNGMHPACPHTGAGLPSSCLSLPHCTPGQTPQLVQVDASVTPSPT